MQEGFDADSFYLRMMWPLRGRGNRPIAIPIPRGLEVTTRPLRLLGESVGLDEKYTINRHFTGIGQTSNYYSGAFVRGSAFQFLFTMWLLVNDDARGKRYGRSLVRSVLCDACKAGSKAALLLTSVDNFVARELYRSEGYETIETVCSFRLG